ncbi:hypothetical protein [Hoeflea prorocentri]|uniref:Uncharacterized protein n=1 Tax=Hoeflea prorocentri TaxID=1922333 RepID=A0A9X3ULS3_9HYPH|nr:hypothetical protein [Hoeflea prorocentri]MCY6383583.1 hypothetical protein [Hoeflea prorocentri]MDA5401383.1 hypothetical protein [Hoeflea prorocentri]
MEDQQFRKSVLVWTSLLVLVLLLHPYIAAAPDHASICGSFVRTCRSAGEVIAMFGRPVAVFLIGSFLLRAVFFRVRWLEISMGWAILALLWLLGSAPFLIGTFIVPGANIALGNAPVAVPTLLLFFVALIGFLAFVEFPFARHLDAMGHVAWVTAFVVACHATLLLAGSIFTGLTLIPYMAGLIGVSGLAGLSQIKLYFVYLAQALLFGLPFKLFILIDLAVFTAALIFVLARQGGESKSVQVSGVPSRWDNPDGQARSSFGRLGEG